MLAGAGFGYDPRFFHLHGEKALADGVVDFVRAGVKQVFALEIDLRAAIRRKMICEALGELEGRGSACKILEEVLKFRLECCVGFGLFVGALEFEKRNHESFGNVAAAVGAETSWNGGGNGELGGHGERTLSHGGLG